MHNECSKIIEEMLKLLRKAAHTVGKRQNEQFFNSYIELDKTCSAMFDIVSDGVGEYINRLNNARFAPNREDVLPRLVRYRNIHKRFNYEPGAINRDNEITKDDINWVVKFKKDVTARRDPISQYLKKARGYAFKKKFTAVMWVILVVAVIALGVSLYFALAN